MWLYQWVAEEGRIGRLRHGKACSGVRGFALGHLGNSSKFLVRWGWQYTTVRDDLGPSSRAGEYRDPGCESDIIGRNRQVRASIYLILDILEAIFIFMSRRERWLPGEGSLRPRKMFFLVVIIGGLM